MMWYVHEDEKIILVLNEYHLMEIRMMVVVFDLSLIAL